MRFATTVSIACTPERLWPCLTEPALIQRWLEDLVDETPEDPAKTTGVGTRSVMRLREGGKVQTYRSVVTAWDPPRHVAVQLTGGSLGEGMAVDVDYRIASEGAGSRLDYAVHVQLKGLFKLMAPVIWLSSKTTGNKSLRKLVEVAEQSGSE